jgi:hypothetical protein
MSRLSLFFCVGLSEQTVTANAVRFPDNFHRINQPFVYVTVDGAAMDIDELGGVCDP